MDCSCRWVMENESLAFSCVSKSCRVPVVALTATLIHQDEVLWKLRPSLGLILGGAIVAHRDVDARTITTHWLSLFSFLVIPNGCHGAGFVSAVKLKHFSGLSVEDESSLTARRKLLLRPSESTRKICKFLAAASNPRLERLIRFIVHQRGC